MPPSDRSNATNPADHGFEVIESPPTEDHGFEVIDPLAPPRRARVVPRPATPPKRRSRGLRAALAVGATAAALVLLAVLSLVGLVVYDYARYGGQAEQRARREAQYAEARQWEYAHGYRRDWKKEGPPPGLKAWDDPDLPGPERLRMRQEGMAAEQSVKDRAEAEQFRAVISAVRRNGRNLEIDYEFTKGFDALDAPSVHRVGFVVSQGGSKSVYEPTFGEVTKKGTLRLKEQSLFSSDARVEVQIVLLDVFRKPKASISNPASAK